MNSPSLIASVMAYTYDAEHNGTHHRCALRFAQQRRGKRLDECFTGVRRRLDYKCAAA